MKNTIYLLTGAAGCLGSNISRGLIAQGKKVRALVLKGDPAEDRIPPEAEIITGDITDTVSLEKFFHAENDTKIIVIHCASMVTVSPDYSEKLYKVNVEGTRNMVHMCLRHRVKKLVYVSSTGAIPELPQGQLIEEVDYFNPDPIVGWYGKTKAMATQIVLDAAREKGLDASVVFPSGIFGPNDYAYGYVSKFIMDYVSGKMPAGIAGSFNAVDVRDLADAIITCTEKGRIGEGYILANETVTIKQMIHTISGATGAREAKYMLPIPAARVIAFLASIKTWITKKPSALTSFAIYNLARNNDFSAEKSKKELGFSTRPFEQTIEDCIAWLAGENKIAIKQHGTGSTNIPVLEGQ